MYPTLKKSLLILMVLPCFCLGQEYDLLKELDSLDQNQELLNTLFNNIK